MKYSIKNNKQIIEVGSLVVYPSIAEAARVTGLRRESIRDVVAGRRNHTAGRVFMLLEAWEAHKSL